MSAKHPNWTPGELELNWQLTLKRFPQLRYRRQLRWNLILRLLAEDRMVVEKHEDGTLRIVPEKRSQVTTIHLPAKGPPQRPLTREAASVERYNERLQNGQFPGEP